MQLLLIAISKNVCGGGKAKIEIIIITKFLVNNQYASQFTVCVI